MDATRYPALSAFHLRMPGMTDQNYFQSLAGVVTPFLMNLGHQRAGRIDNWQVAALGFFLDFRGDTVGAEYGNRAFRYFVELFDENSPLRAQRFDDVLIMDDLVPDIDRRSVESQRPLDDLDCPLDAGAKPARLG